MKIKIIGLLFASLVFSNLSGYSAKNGNKKRPNIILMMCDDLGWGDTGFNGNTIIKTPALDKMADEGVVLSHFYSIGAVCSPTRASFLTGRHYYRMGVFTANKGHLPKDEFTIAHMLKKEGYATGHFGKWHLGTLDKEISAKGKGRKPELNFAPPWQRSYDQSFVTESAVCTWNPAEREQYKNNPYYENGVIASENLQGDDSRIIMDRAIPFIQNSVQNEQPFVAVIWFHAPHESIEAGPDYLKMYKGHGEAAHYYGCITAMDEQVGRLRAEIEGLGIDDNTALFFCSDNGPEGPVPNDRLKTRRAGSAGEFTGRKRSVTDGGVRVPALALWPGKIEAGSKCDVPMSVLDYLPTVSEITGAKVTTKHPIDGENVLPILQGKNKVHKKSIPFRYNGRTGSHACLVKEKYKLIIQSETDKTKDQLFNLATDIKEENNIADEHILMVAEMRQEIISFLESAKHSHSGGDYKNNDFKPVDEWLELGTIKQKKK